MNLASRLTDILTALHSGTYGQREVWEETLREAIAHFTAPLPRNNDGEGVVVATTVAGAHAAVEMANLYGANLTGADLFGLKEDTIKDPAA